MYFIVLIISFVFYIILDVYRTFKGHAFLKKIVEHQELQQLGIISLMRIQIEQKEIIEKQKQEIRLIKEIQKNQAHLIRYARRTPVAK